MNWLKENWFKIVIVLIGVWLSICGGLILYRLKVLSDIQSDVSDNTYKTYDSVSNDLPGIHADLDSIESK